jgi:ATP-dependent DNA ligase
MNLNEFFNHLASDAGRNFKIAELEKHKSNDLLQTVIILALDPFTQFYIRKIPKYTRGVHTIPLVQSCKQLKKLASREYTGNAAIEMLTSLLESSTPDDAKVLERIIQKDLKCGVSISTVNKVWPELIHDYPCMLCSASDEKLISKFEFPAMVQLKMDGMRFNAIVKNGVVEYRSRNGKEIHGIKHLDQDFIVLSGSKNCVFDGELVVNDKGIILDRQTGNGILNKAVKGTISDLESHKIRATVWDVIDYEDFTVGYSSVPYRDRFERITSTIFTDAVRVVEHQMVESIIEAREVFDRYLAAGEEGIILKAGTAPWENKRVKHQLKFKGELECDLRIVGYEEGTGKYVGRLGAIICESGSTDNRVLTVNVGSGFSDDLRTNLWHIRDELLGKIVALKYNSRIKNKQGGDSLFLPIFLEIREDKTDADEYKDIK